jgi:hypothetical protein
MAGPHTFVGSISGDFSEAGNFDTAAVPLTGEAWGVNHLTQRGIDAGLNQSAKTFSRISIDAGFKGKAIASDGSPFLCNATKLEVSGSPTGLYFDGTYTDVIARLGNMAEEGLVLDATITRLQVLAGMVRVIGTDEQPASSQWFVGTDDPAGDDRSAQLYVESGVDLTSNNTKLVQNGGLIDCAASLNDLLLTAGVFNLGWDRVNEQTTAAALALFWQLGGVLNWTGNGTITQGHVGGGIMDANDYDLVRTLTNLTMYGDGLVDFSQAYNLVLSNPIRVLGHNAPRFAPGHTVTVA